MSMAALLDIKRTIAKQREQSIFPREQPVVPARLCNICFVAKASYTCPSCAVPYCSFACFRAKPHADCSAKFSATTLREHQPDPDEEERQKVIDILHRLETGQDEEQEQDDSVPVWWEDDEPTPTKRPDAEVFATSVTRLSGGGQAADLTYNLLAIMMAYAFVTRQVNAFSLAELLDERGDQAPLIGAAFGLLDTLVPFLASRDSLLLTGAQEVSLFLLGHLDLSLLDNSPADLLIGLLKDASKLLEPEKIVAKSVSSPRYRVAASISPDACRHSLALSAIWDLHHFLEQTHKIVDNVQAGAKAAQHKLSFYTAKALLADHFVFAQPALREDINNEIRRLEHELEGAKKEERFASAAKVLEGGEKGIGIRPV